MATDKRFDELVSGWLQADAPARLPGRVLEATFERTRRSRQRTGWRGLLDGPRVMPFATLIGGATVVVVVAAALATGFSGNRSSVGGPAATPNSSAAFLGTWISTSDADGGTQVMTVSAARDGAVEVLVTDSIASVCSGTSSTMTGGGQVEGRGRLVLPEPAYTCDDGSTPKALSGPPLAEQLRNLTFTLDAGAESLVDSGGGLWLRHVEASPGADPTPLPSQLVEASPGADPTPSPSPLAEAQVRSLLDGYLAARVAGSGAQQYLGVPEAQVPLLYATSSGARYDRAEFEQVRGIEWPYGDTAIKVRLFAGTTVVEQLHFIGLDQPRTLVYEALGFATDIPPTTENGEPVAMPYSAFGGQVTLRAAHPWVITRTGEPLFGGRLIPPGPGVRPTTDGGERVDWDQLFLIANPTLGGTRCAAAPDPVGASDLATQLQSMPGVEATAPVAAGIGGAQGLMMDVTIPAGTPVVHALQESGDPCATDILRALAREEGYADTATGERLRLFLVDVPDGLSIHTLAIEVVAPDATFERAVEAAAPVVDSVGFAAP